MESHKLVVDKFYFRLLYASEKLDVPSVETYFYLGKNIKGNEKEDIYYFQDAYSFQNSGSILKLGQSKKRPLTVMPESCLHFVKDIDGLINALQELKKTQ